MANGNGGEPSRGHKAKSSGVRVGLIAGGVVLFLYVVWVLIVLRWGGHGGDDKYGTPGTFGDSFGVVNALFSGLALAAVAVTLWLNQKQLEVQQDELRNSVAEMRGQREQLEAQNAFLAKQATQNQFFQMLSSWQNVLEQVEVQGRRGRSAFAAAAHDVLGLMAKVIVTPSGDPDPTQRKDTIVPMYDRFYRNKDVQIGHYFRLLYHTIRFVNESRVLSDEEKKDFVRILRAHISDGEFVLLFYNCIHPVGEKLHPLIEKYDFLQNMSERSIAVAIDLDFYPMTKARWEAIGKRPEGIKSFD